MRPPRRESSAGIAPQRPGMKTRAYSAPNVPRTDDAAASTQLGSTDEGCETEEITDDAFFQRYHFPHQAPCTEEEDEGGSSAESSSDTEGPLSPTHAKDRQPAGDAASDPSTGSANSDSGAPAMQELNMAVIGARGSGRSTFIRRALGLPDTATTSNCSRTIAIDGSPYLVRFLEMTSDHVHLTERCIIKWPETVHDSATPRIDAAVILYDVTNSDSLGKVPDMLS
ncbi:hypothetical protein CFE70_003366 [Pyrenophora teres f. teres 0-1]